MRITVYSWGVGAGVEREAKSKEKCSNLHLSVASVGTVWWESDGEARGRFHRASVMTMSVKKEPRNVIKCILKGPKKLYI